MIINDFMQAGHSLVVSDIHLADLDQGHSISPLWKRYKNSEYFIDESFKLFLEKMREQASASIELILNGDIFDFDSVMTFPNNSSISVSWLERLRGLGSEEEKSRFKMKAILDAHPVWIGAIRAFIEAGNRVIFIIGNHDMELHWPAVQQDLINRINLTINKQTFIRFCEWFYISNHDTLIEHSNQYDAYCLCSNPVHPLVKRGSKILVRLPFGNLAGKYMVNGMGLMNPHAMASYIKESIWDYFKFYYKFVIRIQPFLMWTWFWSALVTLVFSIWEGLLPSLRDPLTVNHRIEDIAKKSNSTVSMVLALKEVHVHPAIFNPFKILRELWLDRAIFLTLIIFGSFQFFSFWHVFISVSYLWFIIPMALLIPIFIFYARSVQSEVDSAQNAAFHMAPLSGKIANVNRIIHGHTHSEYFKQIEGVSVINVGTWSPAFHDIACTQPYGRKCFAWIQPKINSTERYAELYEWKGTFFDLIQSTPSKELKK